MLYFADERWRQWHKDRAEFRAFAGAKVSIENGEAVSPDPDVWTLHHCGTDGLSAQRNGLTTGQNGGHQAINLAVLLGVRRILLLGFDMKPAADGRLHWFGEHPVATQPHVFSAMLQNFPSMLAPLRAAGVEVVNCTPGSALRCFPQRPLEDELARVLHGEAAAALPA